nr:hypothetical protein [Tanacetum cinerariifolium]
MTFKLNTDINDTEYFERLLEHDSAYQIYAGPQVSSLDLAAPVNDNHNDSPACTHPNAYADANTNLHLTPYTLNDQHQQCTTIRDVTGLAVRNNEESHARFSPLELIRSVQQILIVVDGAVFEEYGTASCL